MTDILVSLGTWNWLIFGFILMALEVLAPGVFLFWLGLAAILVGLISFGLHPAWQMQLVMFAIFAAAAVLIVIARRRRRALVARTQIAERDAAAADRRRFLARLDHVSRADGGLRLTRMHDVACDVGEVVIAAADRHHEDGECNKYITHQIVPQCLLLYAPHVEQGRLKPCQAAAVP